MLGWLNAFKLTKVRLSAILITVAYLGIFIFMQNRRFVASDKAPVLYPINEKTQKLASVVHVGMYINSFPKFSFDTGEFTIDATVWFKFPVATEALATIEQFTIYNSMIQQNGKLLFRSDPIIKLIDDNVIACYHIQTTFKNTMNHKFFPIGDHTLHILLQNKDATVQELVFVSDAQSLSLSKNVLIENWLSREKYVQTGYLQARLDSANPAMQISYPAVLFSIDFDNVGGKKVGSLYIPMLIMFLIGLLSLLLAIDDPTRLGMITGAVPSLALFRLVIDGVSPNVGYATHVDIVFHTFIFLLLTILAFQIYNSLTLTQAKHLAEDVQQKIKDKLENISDVVFIFNLVFLIVMLTYSFYM